LTGVLAGSTLLELVAHVRFGGGAAAVTSCDDGIGYSVGPSKAFNATISLISAHFRQNVAAADYTVNTTLAGTAANVFGTGVLLEIVDIQNTGVDQSANNTGTSTTPTVGPTAALGQNTGLVFYMMATDAAHNIVGSTHPPNTGFTTIANDTSTSYTPFSFGYKNVSNGAAQSADSGTLPFADNWATQIFTFKDVLAAMDAIGKGLNNQTVHAMSVGLRR
jgi:hypothetical protein